VAVLLSKDNNDDSGESRIPFFARAVQKFRRKKDDNDGAVGNLDEVEKGVDDVVDTGAVKTVDAKAAEKPVDSEAAMLRALADKARFEAQKMEMSLTLSKIAKLEEKLKRPDTKDDGRSDILRDIEVLMKKMNGEPQAVPKVAKSAAWASEKKFVSEPVMILGESPSSSDAEETEGENNIVEEIFGGEKPLLSDEKRKDAIDGFEQLPPQIKDMMAKTVGMKDGSNSTAVVEKLMQENRLYEGAENEKFAMTAKADDLEDIFIDMNFAEMNRFVESLLPECTRKAPVDMDYIDALYTEVLGKDTFNPNERKPMAVPGGYLIRGISKLKPQEGRDDGDVVVEALDKAISKSSVAGKIEVYYILDPTPPSGEEILNDEDEAPVLLVTNYDISPNTEVWKKPFITFLGLASIAAFSLGSFSFTEEVLNRIDVATNSDGSLDFLYELSLPIATSVFATQLAHEAGHLIIAIKDGISIGLPTLVPSFQFGITGGVTPIKSSPKNIKSLFDFAIAGPLLGFLVSLGLLYSGLEMTAFMDPAVQAQLPSIPVEMLQSSALGGGIIDYLLGDGVLNSPEAAKTMIKLHPYAIAGFGGLIANALSLLPLGNTDGGRISLAFFGRSFSRVVNGSALTILVVAGLFGADQANILLCYAIYCQFFQKEAEIPCRNEVDELDTTRGFIAIAMAVIVFLTLVPLPQ